MKNLSRDHIVLLLVTVTWGFNYVAIKYALREIDPLAFFTVRNGIGVLAIVTLFLIMERTLPVRRGDLGRLVLLALAGVTVNQLGFIIGMAHTSAANASLLISTSPVFGLVFGIILAGERASLRRWLGVIVALLGCALIVVGGKGELRFGQESIGGDLFVLGASVSWALYAVLSRPMLKDYSPLQLSVYSWVIGFSLGVPVTLEPVFNLSWGSITAIGWAMTLYAGVCLSLTNVIWNRTVAKIGASSTLIFMYIVPVHAVIMAVVFLQETISVIQIVGAVIILAGVNAARSG